MLLKLRGYIRGLIKSYSDNKGKSRLIKRVEKRLSNLPDLSNQLTKFECKAIHDYYNRFGQLVRSYKFHTFYKCVTGNFNVRYLPEDIYYYSIDPFFNNWAMAKFIDNKTFYQKLFPKVAQPEMVCYRQNGYWFDGSGRPIEQKTVKSLLPSNKSFFVKIAQNSYGGHGVQYLNGAMITDFVGSIKEDIVIQQPLQQSEVTSSINPASVNTIRIITLLRKDGSVKLCSMILRMGIGESKVDNASSGGITVGIKPNGKLNKVAFSVEGHKYIAHPTTGKIFEEIELPNVLSVKDLVCEQAKLLPHFRLISWDIALDRNQNPILIEANLCDGELDFHQLNNGPLFGDETEEILNEVFMKKDNP